MGSIPGLVQWVKDLALLWLWCRLAVAALIRPLGWELPPAMGATQKKTKKKKKINSHGYLDPWYTFPNMMYSTCFFQTTNTTSFIISEVALCSLFTLWAALLRSPWSLGEQKLGGGNSTFPAQRHLLCEIQANDSSSRFLVS